MARLRGAIWQSIFTHDMRRYRRSLYLRMGDFWATPKYCALRAN